MRAAVIGGTGSVGALVVEELAARGDEVRIVSRRAPGGAGSRRAADAGGRVAHHRADVSTGEGLAEALEGVDVVVNAVGDVRGRPNVLVEGTRRLLAAEAVAGVGHHVAISIVGCERSQVGFHRTTLAQEAVLVDGPVPWTMLRATQFHSLVDRVLSTTARARMLPSGSGRLQPIDPAVVASSLADAARGGPVGRLPDIAGPEVATVAQLADAWRAARARGPFVPLPVPGIGALGRALRDGVLCEPDAAVAGPTFVQWLRRRDAGVPASSAR